MSNRDKLLKQKNNPDLWFGLLNMVPSVLVVMLTTYCYIDFLKPLFYQYVRKLQPMVEEMASQQLSD